MVIDAGMRHKPPETPTEPDLTTLACDTAPPLIRHPAVLKRKRMEFLPFHTLVYHPQTIVMFSNGNRLRNATQGPRNHLGTESQGVTDSHGTSVRFGTPEGSDTPIYWRGKPMKIIPIGTMVLYSHSIAMFSNGYRCRNATTGTNTYHQGTGSHGITGSHGTSMRFGSPMRSDTLYVTGESNGMITHWYIGLSFPIDSNLLPW